MAFFDNLSKKVGEVAQNAAKKSNEFIETNKINSNINAEEDKIKKTYSEIGKRLYDSYYSNPEGYPEFQDLCEEIRICEQNIADLRQKINDIKRSRTCTECNREIEQGIVFCPHCGSKQAGEKAPEVQNDSYRCISCGSELAEGSVFCGVCGQKQN